ncbi:MAG: FAD-dependent oxidoreductase, partial [Planctomycetales bacterium]|nr:FAD-dependent oxidoreductase [Planctomycetales bacterium]
MKHFAYKVRLILIYAAAVWQWLGGGACHGAAFNDHDVDICIYGATSAGVVAAVQAARLGRSVTLVEPGLHLGGMSAEGLGGTDIDNHPGFQNSPAVGGLALEFYRRVSERYGRVAEFDAMRESLEREPSLWQFEPHVAEEVFNQMVSERSIRVLRGSRLAEEAPVAKKDARIVRIRCANGVDIRAKCFIDATYEGDLLAAAGIRFAIGREGNAVYGETKNGVRNDTTHAQFDRRIDPYVIPGDASSGVIFGVLDKPVGTNGDPDDSIQAYCFRLCVTTDAHNRLPFTKPESYDPAHYELQRRYLAAGGRIGWPKAFLPKNKADFSGWHQLAGNLIGWNHAYALASYDERSEMLKVSREYVQGLYWFLANDPAAPEGMRREWARWGLCR